MRVLILLLFPFMGACQWSSLASNQTVSNTNLANAVANGVFTAKTSIPSNGKMLTRSEAESYVNINSISLKATNQLVVKQDLSAPSIYMTITSGVYPVTGPNNTTQGTIYNNNAFDVYIILVFNSGGQSSGTVGGDIFFIMPPAPSASMSVYGTITGVGTTLTSQYNIPLYSGIVTIPASSSRNFDLQKADGFSSGSTLRIYYSSVFSGPYSPIPL